MDNLHEVWVSSTRATTFNATLLFAGKSGKVKIYPAPEEEYTHDSWEILVDLEDDLNDWGVRKIRFDLVACGALAIIFSWQGKRLGSRQTRPELARFVTREHS